VGGLFTENFVQNHNTQSYDFLWVVDNSGSMSNIRDYMSQQLNTFVSTLQSRQYLDWQMSVTVTDHVDIGGESCGRKRGYSRVKSPVRRSLRRLGVYYR